MKARLVRLEQEARRAGFGGPSPSTHDRAEERVRRMTMTERRARRFELLDKHLSFTLGRPATGAELAAWIGGRDYFQTLAGFAANGGDLLGAARWRARAERLGDEHQGQNGRAA